VEVVLLRPLLLLPATAVVVLLRLLLLLPATAVVVLLHLLLLLPATVAVAHRHLPKSAGQKTAFAELLKRAGCGEPAEGLKSQRENTQTE
jgi:hypothetical protein